MKIVYSLQFPSSSLLKGMSLEILPKRKCLLKGQYEDEDGYIHNISLSFEEVEAYKCTYITSCKETVISSAYDKLVDCEDTDWLKEIFSTGNHGKSDKKLRHYMIFFDDGPCYEIICTTFKLS